MAVTPATLQAKFRELASVVAGDLQPWIDESELNVCRTAFGSKADLAVSYLAAHLWKRFGSGCVPDSAPGPATSKRVDQLAKSYAIGQHDLMSDADLATTAYGQRFLALRRLTFPGRCR